MKAKMPTTIASKAAQKAG